MTKPRYASLIRHQEPENDENRNHKLSHHCDSQPHNTGSVLAWPLLSYSVFSLYHWLFLQSIGKTSQIQKGIKIDSVILYRFDNTSESQQHAVPRCFRPILQSSLQTPGQRLHGSAGPWLWRALHQTCIQAYSHEKTRLTRVIYVSLYRHFLF